MARLSLSAIIRDPEIQPREKMDQEVVTQYAEDMLAGIAFPSVIVYHDGEFYWMADGFHRAQAAEDAGLEDVEADIRTGSRAAAIWEAVRSNRQHDAAGLRRKNADKRRAVIMALRHPNATTMSDYEIADHCGVSPEFVRKLRSICQPLADKKPRRRRVVRSRNGRKHTYSMQINGSSRDQSRGRDEADPSDTSVSSEAEPSSGLGSPSFALDPNPEPPKPATKPVFNQTNEMVEWAWWTWNPVTGCKHDCVYCYARDIANRFYPEKFEPTFRPERLEAPRNTAFPEKARTEIGWRNVFVCSMADLFGRWVPDPWIEDVFASCRKSPEWNYLFLTKFPLRYEGLDFPETAWVGTSVDEQRRVANAEKAFAKVKAPVKWLSLEPLREPLKFKRLDLFDWVVIGGQSKSSQAPEFLPPFEWVADVVTQAKQAGCQVYIKPNIGFDGPTRPREYPGRTEEE